MGVNFLFRIIIGLTQFTNKAHIARATLEAVSFQTREVSSVLSFFLRTHASEPLNFVSPLPASQLHFLANENAELAGRSQ